MREQAQYFHDSVSFRKENATSAKFLRARHCCMFDYIHLIHLSVLLSLYYTYSRAANEITLLYMRRADDYVRWWIFEFESMCIWLDSQTMTIR